MLPHVEVPRLCAVIDADVAAAAGWSVNDLARACLTGGARWLQVRAKKAGSLTLLSMCEGVLVEAAPYGAIVIVNDRADVARLASAAGVHLGQEDPSPRAVRRIVGARSIVGLSTHTPDQVQAATEEPVSYLAVGPLFESGTKATGYAAVGLELVRYAAAWTRSVTRGPGRARLPVVAIGGITLDRAASVIAAGGDSVAVIGDLLRGGDPERRVRAYVERLGG